MSDVSAREHGTLASYVKAKCRCFRCRCAAANHVADRRGEMRAPYRLRYVANGAVWVVTENRIGGEVIMRTTVRAAAKKRRDSLNRAHRTLPDIELVSAHRSAKRLQELLVVGLTMTTIEQRSEIDTSTLGRILAGKTKRTYRATEDAILGVAVTIA